ncbi:Similar to hypothetical protein AOL_s00004g78 [Arthrobotrys oligospora ATCC 24927]; acc. no. EGX54045 [Pyronema omphalodes CBS 100304]|uniref:DUF7708 domain-containing protein n=1 Tax=Pyronema omphalodes (strain CBS 100304) TaxID=1076935 RepID=U4LFV5_PYROM|nr:Similar to hypothetical protein AOL_s00004g78 [Arthrobotrys oligospora ATCC 24927]; acc. no. EGX54045 [Pyronema omphalodes CBS 100304]
MEIIVGSQSSVSWSKWYTEDPNERESVKAYADLAAAEQQRWKTKGRRKVLDGMSTRLSYCQKLADNYKFIVDAVKSVHSQFVGAAWGTLGIFVQVLIQKNAKEEKFDSSLQSIVKSLPLLSAYEELYSTRRMRECMVNLYVKIMEFFQETYLYFKRPSWKRVVSAIIEPAEFKLTLLVDEIGNLSKEIAIQTDLKAVTQLFVDSNYDSALNFSTYKTVTTIPRDTSEVQYSTQLQSRLTSETTPQMLWLMRDNYC